MSAQLEAALAYAARGWPVLWLYTAIDGRCSCGRAGCKSPGKHPRGNFGVHDATTDPDVLPGWAASWPDANIAIACGAPGPTVLDIDKPDLAPSDVREIEAPEVATARGAHKYLAGTDQGTIALPYGELRGRGSYVVAPPSVHLSGKVYVWTAEVNGSLPAVPAFVVAERKPTGAGGAPPTQHVAPGEMYEHLKDRAVRLVRAGMSDVAAIERALLAEFEALRVPGATYNGDEVDTRRLAEWAASSDIAQRERGTRAGDVDHALGAIPGYPISALPGAAQDLVDHGTTSGLPAALIGGAALAALAAALGGEARIEVVPTWPERAILWIPLMAPRGAGKSPTQGFAFGRLRQREDAPLIADMTLEALARTLHGTGGAAAIDVDELAVLLRGLGEYKRGTGGDRGRFLGLWTGTPWRLQRVGGGASKNKVDLHIARPTLVICGGLQTARHEYLGSADDGFRPRWLPHLAAIPDVPERLGSTPMCGSWEALIDDLYDKRHFERTWTLSPAALDAFQDHRRRWKTQARAEGESVSAALVKADIHLARIALVIAEAEQPGVGGVVEVGVIERAARIVDFTLDCWRALPEQGGMTLSRRDEILDKGITRLVAWLDEHGGDATRREIARAHVAGVRTTSDLDALLARYEAIFPGTVTTENPARGGLPTAVVRAPRRNGGGA